MSTTLKRNSASSWRKRHREVDNSIPLDLDIKELKRPRYGYFRLESESSKASEDDTESVYSLQDKETDVIADTSDTETEKHSEKEEYEVEFEYEVASLSESEEHGVVISSSDSDDMMLAAAAAVICDVTEAFITDGEDSDSSSDETSFGRTDFSTCVQCRGENDNPLYRYCEKCFQDRKKFFPPRPRRNRRKPLKTVENPVKLDTLRNCLSGLSQDSGISSSQECPSLGLDQIVVPEHLQSTGTSRSEGKCNLDDETPPESSSQEISNKGLVSGTDSNLRRKRQSSESSLSDFEVKKPKIDLLHTQKSDHTSDLGSEISSTSSFSFTITDKSSNFSGSSFASEKSSSSFSEKNESSELCMFCNNAPKDSIFLHTNIAHRCCCYKCAKKTLKTIKRCPICNRSVNKVVRIFTS